MAKRINTSVLAAWAVVRWGVPYALLSTMARAAADAGKPDAAIDAASAAAAAPGEPGASRKACEYVI